MIGFVRGKLVTKAPPHLTVDVGGVRIGVAAPIYSESPNAVDGERTSTLGIGFFKDRRLFVDYPGSRLLLE